MMSNSAAARESAEIELLIGEKLLWAGKPDPRRKMAQGVPALLIGASFTLGALIGGWVVYSGSFFAPHTLVTGQTFVFLAFGLPFLVIGLILGLLSMSAPLIFYHQAEMESYAVTDRRVLIIQEGKPRTVDVYAAGEFGRVQSLERADGSGTLIFFGSVDEEGFQLPSAQFLEISDVRRVEGIVRDWLLL